jgi:type IV secretory pathway TraG/TraD family ATPase VirD4
LPVLFLLDEFAALGRLKSIETAIGYMAGFGVQLWPFIQDVSQLRDLYPHRWESFMANAGVLQAFGVNDTNTAEIISRSLGTTTVTLRDLTAFSEPVDLRELTQTDGAEDGQTWIWRGADCFQVKADRGADGAGQNCGIGVSGSWCV